MRGLHGAGHSAPGFSSIMITLQNITLYQGATPLLEQASIAIYPGQKIGVIGRNG
jgi:ATPase subunit of ABC transporter with duplicated ATPase domains